MCCQIPRIKTEKEAALALSQVFSSAFERKYFTPESVRKLERNYSLHLSANGFVVEPDIEAGRRSFKRRKMMAEVDLDYEPSSLCGPPDIRVAHFLEEYRGNKLDPSYLRHIQRWHGGVPRRQYFDADGSTFRVGRFLTLVDRQSTLEPPFRRSWQFPERDVRIDWSVLTLIDEEGPSCRHLFGGEKLLPFAALYRGAHHPDEMQLTEGDCDLVCFLYDSNEQPPSVAVWQARQAQQESWRWEEALKMSGWNAEVRVQYEDFTRTVAGSFDAFLELLRAEP